MEPNLDIGRIRLRVRELSKSLLGARFRAEVAAFIAVGEAPFWARSLAEQLDIPENKISAELLRFASDGLLIAVPSQAWDRRKLFERANAPNTTYYWKAGLELVRRAAQEEADRTGLTASSAMALFFRDVDSPLDGFDERMAAP